MISLAHKLIADDKGGHDDYGDELGPLSPNLRFMHMIERVVKAGKFCFYPSDQEDQVKVHIKQQQNTWTDEYNMLACGEHSP